jgi:aminoglycoside N3'-acetyltransferase
MFRTTPENLFLHLHDELELEKDALVWLHSGIKGLGLINGGIKTITDSFSNVLTHGALIIPTFSYSWNNGKVYNIESTECNDMGGYAKIAWKDPRFKRTSNPNFSVAVIDNTTDKRVEKTLFSEKKYMSCFGDDSVFRKIEQMAASGMPSYIILLGGAHDDVVFRTTFLHMIEESVSVPYRYNKCFFNPEKSGEEVDQYVRFMNETEYQNHTGVKPPMHYNFPIKEKYFQLGEDLKADGLIQSYKFGYSYTRIVPMCQFFSWLESKLIQDPEYLLK